MILTCGPTRLARSYRSILGETWVDYGMIWLLREPEP